MRLNNFWCATFVEGEEQPWGGIKIRFDGIPPVLAKQLEAAQSPIDLEFSIPAPGCIRQPFTMRIIANGARATFIAEAVDEKVVAEKCALIQQGPRPVQGIFYPKKGDEPAELVLN
jgi:hypothetical protein